MHISNTYAASKCRDGLSPAARWLSFNVQRFHEKRVLRRVSFSDYVDKMKQQGTTPFTSIRRTKIREPFNFELSFIQHKKDMNSNLISGVTSVNPAVFKHVLVHVEVTTDIYLDYMKKKVPLLMVFV